MSPASRRTTYALTGLGVGGVLDWLGQGGTRLVSLAAAFLVLAALLVLSRERLARAAARFSLWVLIAALVIALVSESLSIGARGQIVTSVGGSGLAPWLLDLAFLGPVLSIFAFQAHLLSGMAKSGSIVLLVVFLASNILAHVVPSGPGVAMLGVAFVCAILGSAMLILTGSRLREEDPHAT